ncbi:V8-like Glu-specific endopeptidase [Loktanella atrilutea]|uniref:V8-like Glu-specific endopeptidase n=1 Tax=Loktanella atrilutea TaxID=366533 RepID=A0A1M5CAP8_LOKAT|nr:trypsin-like serine protease [Loktanella atrilutea]SHF51815.1 V8-like Glu-specific endopeptidase [Loktanella atrilutea]
MRNLLLVLILGILASRLPAQDTDLQPMVTKETSRGWEAVGRLDIDRSGFCTAALIAETTILTAAHCLFDDQGARIPPDRFTFLAGLRDDRAAATRAVTRATPHPDYIHHGARAQNDAVSVDLAVLELDRPIRLPSLAPYPVGVAPTQDMPLTVVSYARDRANIASLQKTCHVLDAISHVVMMTCAADFGASGAPVFATGNGIARIVAVLSAKGESDGDAVSLAATVSDTLDALLAAHITAQTPILSNGPRFTASGARNDTGAKFVRP